MFGTANSAVVAQMTTAAGDALDTGTAVLPLALGLFGFTVAIGFGIKVWRKVAGR